jgi:hypothetical protein
MEEITDKKKISISAPFRRPPLVDIPAFHTCTHREVEKEKQNVSAYHYRI